MKRSDILSLMPSIFQRSASVDASFSALVDTMEVMQAPSENVLNHLNSFFNPHLAPDDMNLFMAHWVDLDWLWVGDHDDVDQEALREMLIHSFDLAKWRGTVKGLTKFLEMATHIKGFEILENVDAKGNDQQFHLLVKAPKAAQDKEKIIQHIISNEKAVYLSHELQFVDKGKGK